MKSTVKLALAGALAMSVTAFAFNPGMNAEAVRAEVATRLANGENVDTIVQAANSEGLGGSPVLVEALIAKGQPLGNIISAMQQHTTAGMGASLVINVALDLGISPKEVLFAAVPAIQSAPNLLQNFLGVEPSIIFEVVPPFTTLSALTEAILSGREGADRVAVLAAVASSLERMSSQEGARTLALFTSEQIAQVAKNDPVFNLYVNPPAAGNTDTQQTASTTGDTGPTSDSGNTGNTGSTGNSGNTGSNFAGTPGSTAGGGGGGGASPS